MTAKSAAYLLITLLIFAALAGSMLVQHSPASAANDWYVATTGSDLTGDGSSGNPWATINHAIGEAAGGDTIHIGPGWFFEQVEIRKPLTLIGADVDPSPAIGTFIASPLTDNFTYPSHEGTVFDYVVAAHDNASISISNLTIVAREISGSPNTNAPLVFDNVTGTASGLDSGCVSGWFSNNIADIDIAIWGGSNVTVQNSELVNYSGYGVLCNQSSVTAENNLIRSDAANSICVLMERALYGLFHNNGLYDGLWGVRVDGCDNLTLWHNGISEQSAGGIQLRNYLLSGQVAILDNGIWDIAAGIGISNPIPAVPPGPIITATIVDNDINSCDTAISLANPISVCTAITDNLIWHNNRGLYLACPLEYVAGNIFYSNVIGIEAHSDLAAHCNAIMGNTTDGLNIADDGTFNVINNYWGSNSGPNVDGHGPGTGDNITTNHHEVDLTFDPWAAMNLSATPAAILADGVSLSTLDLDCTRNSNGDVMGCNIPDGNPIRFTTTAGTLTSDTALTSGGHAVTSLISSTTPGTATVYSGFAAAPDLTVSTATVTFNAAAQPPPPPPPQQFGINAGPGSHGSSMITTVTSQGPQNLPNVEVSAARLSTLSTTPGSPVTVRADVTNTGTANGTAVVKVYLNDEPAATQGVNVARGSTVPVTFTIAPSQPGEYTVRVNNVQAGSLKVKDFNDSDIIFAVAFAAFILIFAALLLVYLRRRRLGIS